MNVEAIPSTSDAPTEIDWRDCSFAVFIGALYVPLKSVELLLGNPGNIGLSLGDMLSIVCLAYILWRAQRQPEKLREWGLSTPISVAAAVSFAVLLVIAIASMASISIARTGSLPFEIGYIFRMVDYVSGAFPQQFLVFAVGVTNAEKIPFLRGQWRLPLILGTLFCLAHLPMPSQSLWGIPVQILATFPLGFVATYYFLRFRTILPLVAIHAIGFILLTNWVGN